MSETCFSHCVQSLNSRKLEQEEAKCVDSCIGKFVRFNHRVMQLYATAQGELMQKRMKENEEEAAKQAKEAATSTPAIETSAQSTTDIATDVNSQIESVETVDVKS